MHSCIQRGVHVHSLCILVQIEDAAWFSLAELPEELFLGFLGFFLFCFVLFFFLFFSCFDHREQTQEGRCACVSLAPSPHLTAPSLPGGPRSLFPVSVSLSFPFLLLSHITLSTTGQGSMVEWLLKAVTQVISQEVWVERVGGTLRKPCVSLT